MKQREDIERQAGNSVEERAAVRKPYQKPAVSYEKIFETSALRCGKVQATQGSCRFNRRTS